MPTQNRQKRDYRDEPAYWFGVLQIARERDDCQRAAEAQRELHRLGVTVRFDSQRAGGKAAHA